MVVASVCERRIRGIIRKNGYPRRITRRVEEEQGGGYIVSPASLFESSRLRRVLPLERGDSRNKPIRFPYTTSRNWYRGICIIAGWVREDGASVASIRKNTITNKNRADGT